MDKTNGTLIILGLISLIFYWSKIPHKQRIVWVLIWLGIIAMVVVAYNFVADLLNGIAHASGD
jgi:hypothetical protein